jgi:hypothetical protein
MDEMFTSRTLNLPSGKPFVTLQMLMAQRTSKFELTHKLGLGPIIRSGSRNSTKNQRNGAGEFEEVKSLT